MRHPGTLDPRRCVFVVVRPAFARVAIVLLAVTAVALGVVASHLASERDAARMQAGSLESDLASIRAQSAYFSRRAFSLDASVGGLQRQVTWDKTHLADCWAVIVGVIPARAMAPPARQRRRAAFTAGSIGGNTVRCATDAVP